MPTTKLMTIPQAGEALHLSKSTLARLVAKGEIRTIAIGRSRRITESELARFVAAREADSQPAA